MNFDEMRPASVDIGRFTALAAAIRREDRVAAEAELDKIADANHMLREAIAQGRYSVRARPATVAEAVRKAA